MSQYSAHHAGGLLRSVGAGLAASAAHGAVPPGGLANSELNQLRHFVPAVSTDGSYAARFVPHVHVTTPWGDKELLELEVPEFIWATIEGDAHNDSPFFYGRAHTPNHVFRRRPRPLLHRTEAISPGDWPADRELAD